MSENTISHTPTAEDMPPQTPQPNLGEVDLNQIPEQFRTAEDPLSAMANAYTEAQKKITEQGQQISTFQQPQSQPQVPSTQTGKLEIGKPPEPQQQTQTSVVEEFEKIYQENGGQLTEANYKTLADRGFDKASVDKFIAGQELQFQQLQTQVFSHFGNTEEGFNNATAWARANMSQQDIAALDEMFADPAKANIAAQHLANLHKASAGQGDPKLRLEALDNVVDGGDVFENEWEFQEAMKHPEYGKGGTYDKNFDAKTARSMRAGKIS